MRLAESLAELLSCHDVVVATSVTEALASIEVEPFDCILCDGMMPSLSGVDLHAELERRGRCAGERARSVRSDPVERDAGHRQHHTQHDEDHRAGARLHG